MRIISFVVIAGIKLMENKKEVTKMRVVVANAWSVTMLQKRLEIIRFELLTTREAQEMVEDAEEVVSIIGHPGTADVFSRLLKIEILARRVFYKMSEEDIMLVGSLSQRLPEGKVLSARELENVPITWWRVSYQ